MRRLPTLGLLVALIGVALGLLGPVGAATAQDPDSGGTVTSVDASDTTAAPASDDSESTTDPSSDDTADHDAGRVSVIEIEGLIDPVLADFIKRSIDEGERAGVVAVVLQLNSEGTALDTAQLRALTRRIDEARVPVAVWIGPSGSVARGGAATIAGVADLVGIAPGSRLGKTGLIHSDIEGRLSPEFHAAQERLRRNTINAEEAKELGIAPTDAPVIGDFLLDVPGFETRTVEVDGVQRREPVTVPVFSSIPIQDQLFHTVASPPAAYLLLLLGLALIVFEMYTAGVGIAGLVGAAFFLLSAYGLSVLSARPLGIALLVLSVFGFTVDVQTGSPRLWSIVGGLALIAGSLTLYDDHSLSWIALGAGFVGLPVFMIYAMPTMVRTRFATSAIDREFLIGEEGAAVTRLAPEGIVRIDGALWKARADGRRRIDVDDSIRVVDVEGVLLRIEAGDDTD